MSQPIQYIRISGPNPCSYQVLVPDAGTSIGVAYSQKKQMIFWTDAAKDAIFSANMDGSNKRMIAKEGRLIER